MTSNIKNLKNDIKLSFSKVKEHINSLESQIISLKTQLKDLTEAINSQNLIKAKDLTSSPQEPISTGNKGVYSFIHSNIQSSIHSTNTQEILTKITKQELLVLLTIAQLEEELTNVTYGDLSTKLKLSQGCIRGYITSLIRKGAPIYKEKYNNKITLIKTTPHFKIIDKQVLIDSFYKIDPYQRKLTD